MQNILITCVLLLRMKKLKEEMEGVVKELNENNHFLERYVPDDAYLYLMNVCVSRFGFGLIQ